MTPTRITPNDLERSVDFVVDLAAMLAADQIADHGTGQLDADAQGKGEPGWEGRLRCLRHVIMYSAHQVALVIITRRALGLPLDSQALRSIAISQTISAVTHFVMDRKFTTGPKIAKMLTSGNFWNAGDRSVAPTGSGAYAVDRAWHEFCIHVGQLTGTVTASAWKTWRARKVIR